MSTKDKLIILFSTIVGLVITIYHYGTPWGFIYKNNFKAYLKEKYNEEFVVFDMSYDIMHNSHHAYAYPKQYPEIKFYVGQNNNTKEIRDNYYPDTWMYEARAVLIPKMNELYPNQIHGGVNIAETILVTESVLEKIPNFRESAILDIGISRMDINIDEENRYREFEPAFALIQFIKKEDIKIASFEISYNNKYLRLRGSELILVKEPAELETWLHNYKLR